MKRVFRGRLASFLLFVVAAAPLASCGYGDEEAEVSQRGLAVPALEMIRLGNVTLDNSGAYVDRFAPPFFRAPTAASEALRRLSVSAQDIADSDPTRYHTMRVDFSTGDVFAVARPHPRKAAAPLVAAPLDPASSRINGLVVTPLDASGGYDDRVYVGSSYFDGFIDVKHNGYLTGIGQCSGTLFAASTVVTASHCVIGTSGAAASVSFSPRRRSSSSTPFGTGTSSWAEWESAYTSHNCHVSYSWSPCVYYDFMIVGFSGDRFRPTPDTRDLPGMEIRTSPLVMTERPGTLIAGKAVSLAVSLRVPTETTTVGIRTHHSLAAAHPMRGLTATGQIPSLETVVTSHLAKAEALYANKRARHIS